MINRFCHQKLRVRKRINHIGCLRLKSIDCLRVYSELYPEPSSCVLPFRCISVQNEEGGIIVLTVKLCVAVWIDPSQDSSVGVESFQ
ncbi:hypothetical protein IFM89_009971 [Coptis chinensis]|uniref:Uncharacterized protein n=1 Tax=Coptis chinensis TaxID=261450 RepID=A0A835HLK0_9MAGN|nr:hypothetical protein IFM89_009971 [Coptis chinensis]